jgi:hypothetical protein
LADVITRTLPVRSEVAREHTWDAESVFASEAEWQAEFDQVSTSLPDLAEFKGHLGAGPDQVADYFQAAEAALRSMGRIQVYANMFTAVDSSDQAATARAFIAGLLLCQRGRRRRRVCRLHVMPPESLLVVELGVRVAVRCARPGGGRLDEQGPVRLALREAGAVLGRLVVDLADRLAEAEGLRLVLHA